MIKLDYNEVMYELESLIDSLLYASLGHFVRESTKKSDFLEAIKCIHLYPLLRKLREKTLKDLTEIKEAVLQ